MRAENFENKGCLQMDSAEHRRVCESVEVVPIDMEGKGQCTAGTFGKDTEP